MWVTAVQAVRALALGQVSGGRPRKATPSPALVWGWGLVRALRPWGAPGPAGFLQEEGHLTSPEYLGPGQGQGVGVLRSRLPGSRGRSGRGSIPPSPLPSAPLPWLRYGTRARPLVTRALSSAVRCVLQRGRVPGQREDPAPGAVCLHTAEGQQPTQGGHGGPRRWPGLQPHALSTGADVEEQSLGLAAGGPAPL